MARQIWPSGGGEVGALLRGWTGTECVLGAPAAWPSILRSTLQTVLLSPMPMTLLWGEAGIMLYNDAYAVIAGARHPAILGRGVFDAWPEVSELNREIMGTVGGGTALAYRDMKVVLHRSGVAEDVWLNVDYSPVLDEDGACPGILAIVFETTANVIAQHEREAAEQALRRREQQLAQVQQIGRVGGLEVDLRDGFHNRRSPEYLQIHGLPPDAAQESHEAWVARIHPEDRIAAEAQFRNALAGAGSDYHAQYRIIRPSDKDTRWISATGRIERDETGRATRLVGAHLDITERKEAEAHQRLLMQELAHRVKNTLAMIQAIASQTMRNAPSLEAASETFSARLAALSRAHDLLVEGRNANAAIADIAASVTSIQGDPGRFTMNGPDILLGPKSSLALSLILHELTTNAVKYGALSNDAGRVHVTWRVDIIEGHEQFRLRWQETGGPAVSAPSRRGFGSRLIERTFSAEGCRTDSAYLPGGLVFTLDAPLDALKGTDADA